MAISASSSERPFSGAIIEKFSPPYAIEYTDQTQCSICLEEFMESTQPSKPKTIKKPIQILPCMHHFHAECIDKYFHENFRVGQIPTCALCRKAAPVNPLNDVRRIGALPLQTQFLEFLRPSEQLPRREEQMANFNEPRRNAIQPQTLILFQLQLQLREVQLQPLLAELERVRAVIRNQM